jgi:hypothetical protein
VADIVVLSVVPTTRAVSPLVTALADAALIRFSYVVDDVSFTVTFSPADVNSPKPEDDTLLTFPTDPPAAGPDRALAPPPPNPGDPPDAAVVDAVVPEPELEVPPQAESPIAGTSSPTAAAMDGISWRLKGVCWRVMMLFPFRVIGIARSFSAARGRVHTDVPETLSP